MSEKKIPDNRFVIRPDIDPEDDGAVKNLARDIASWVVAQRDRFRRREAERESASSQPCAPETMAAKGGNR